MEERGFRILLISFMILASFSLISAATCELDVILINQDPFPAVPGDYVDMVFQVTGVDNPECGEVSIELKGEFPISFDPGEESIVTIQSGTYTPDFGSFLIAPYEVRVSEEALEGDNPIEVQFSNTEGGTRNIFSEKFDLNIQETRAEFEVSIKDYFPETRTLRFEILNVGENDIEALTIEIPKQENVIIKGSNRNIVGDLDSNDDTTFDFEAEPSDGEITLIIRYTDQINERRTLEKMVTYDSTYFKDRAREAKGLSTSFYLLIALIIAIIIYWFWKRRQRRRHRRPFEHR